MLMTNEHRAFLAAKNEKQIEHIAGCEQCFNYYLFGEKFRCKEYPSKHRIKKHDFDMLLRRTSSDVSGASFMEHQREVMKQLVILLRRRFSDDTLTGETLDEITIVDDSEWTASDVLEEESRKQSFAIGETRTKDETMTDTTKEGGK